MNDGKNLPFAGWDNIEQTESATASAGGRLEVLIVGRNTLRLPVDDLPATLQIGRAPAADVRVNEQSISREHAILRVTEASDEGVPILTIEDLGSSNGTRVRGIALPPSSPTTFLVGEVVDIGKAMLIVQRSDTTERPRRLSTHDYFELRLEEECARAKSSGSPLAILRIRGEGPTPPRALEALITDALRPFDILASYAPGEYEILLIDAPEEFTTNWARQIEVRLAEHGLGAQIGHATYPKDARSPETLSALAGKRLTGAGTAEHNPLYVPVASDPAMLQLERLIERVAPSDINVLILGETGVGKEVMAEQIHTRSHRSNKPLVRLNCAALSPTLLESELFGHERGAFTGATATKPGLLETAHGGTVLLDEVGEIPFETQVKLLRVIEEQKVLRVGSVKPVEIDVRFLSATNRNLEQAIWEGKFRSDLFYRLSGVSLMIPPLRDRRSAIGPLATNFANTALTKQGIEPPARFSAPASALLTSYYWPGNIRELKNVIERAVLLAGASTIDVAHLPREKLTASVLQASRPAVAVNRFIPPPRSFGRPLSSSSGHDGPTGEVKGSEGPDPLEPLTSDLKNEIHNLERKRIVEALEKCAGNQTQAAKLLGMSRRTLLYRLDLYGIPRPRKNPR